MIAEPDFLCSIEMNTVNPFYAIQSKRARDLQPLRSANLAVGVLTLILLVAVPVSGAPALKVGSNSSYTLSFSITFSPPFCETSPSSDPQMIVYCPMIAIVPPTFNINTSDMMERQPIHTMWWANGPLHLNQTIPVLFFPANVTGSTTVDLGSLGTRAAWTLTYNFTLPTPLPQQETSGTSIPTGDKIQAAFAFNYDQQSDLLLSASADIHAGYLEESTYQTDQCNPSTTTSTTWCSDASSSTFIIQSGLSIQASLTLANTSLNLDQRLVPTDPSGGSTTASGLGSGSETGSGSDGGTRSGSGTGTGGYDQGPSSGPGSGSNPGSIPQSASPKPSPSMDPWVYWIIAIALIAIIGTSLWVARRRKNRGSPAAPPTI